MKLKKGDQVLVVRGKDRGRKGKIEKIFPKTGKAFVPGINLYKKHVRPQSESKPGGVVEVVKPLPISNLAFLCPKCRQKTRIGYQIGKNGEKNRICKKCQSLI